MPPWAAATPGDVAAWSAEKGDEELENPTAALVLANEAFGFEDANNDDVDDSLN
jgi:hypothetical protein